MYLCVCEEKGVRETLKLETYFYAHPDIVNISTDKYMCLYRVRTLKSKDC